MKNMFTNHTPEANDPVELVIYTPDLGKFAITGSFQDVEPSYDQIRREEAAVRKSGKFALSGF